MAFTLHHFHSIRPMKRDTPKLISVAKWVISIDRHVVPFSFSSSFFVLRRMGHLSISWRLWRRQLLLRSFSISQSAEILLPAKSKSSEWTLRASDQISLVERCTCLETATAIPRWKTTSRQCSNGSRYRASDDVCLKPSCSRMSNWSDHYVEHERRRRNARIKGKTKGGEWAPGNHDCYLYHWSVLLDRSNVHVYERILLLLLFSIKMLNVSFCSLFACCVHEWQSNLIKSPSIIDRVVGFARWWWIRACVSWAQRETERKGDAFHVTTNEIARTGD